MYEGGCLRLPGGAIVRKKEERCLLSTTTALSEQPITSHRMEAPESMFLCENVGERDRQPHHHGNFGSGHF